MAFNDVVLEAQKYFPNLRIAYKNQSSFMKALGTLLFFNKPFMTSFVTTVGDTVFFPDQQYTQTQAGIDVFIHECVHMHDEARLGFFFNLGYLFPQLLALPAIILFLFSWKIALLVMLLCLLPLPAPWRAYFEKRAYLVQLYVLRKVWDYVSVAQTAVSYNSFFTTGAYYWMWIFGYDEQFLQAASEIDANQYPAQLSSDTDLKTMVDALIAAAKK